MPVLLNIESNLTDMFVISTPKGFVDSVDGRYHENFVISYAEKRANAKQFVSKKTARNWAESYQLDEYEILKTDN